MITDLDGEVPRVSPAGGMGHRLAGREQIHPNVVQREVVRRIRRAFPHEQGAGSVGDRNAVDVRANAFLGWLDSDPTAVHECCMVSTINKLQVQ
jgi:hypothetical protein